jgi:hypothetical protein
MAVPKIEAAPNMALVRQLMDEGKIKGLDEDSSNYANLIGHSFFVSEIG